MINAGECRRYFEEVRARGDFELLFPEVADLQGVPQPVRYHAEGDAFVHTMLALASVSDEADPRVFWGTLLHDIGKASTTQLVDGAFRSYGHGDAGAEMVPAIMRRIGLPDLAEDVAWLVRNHLFHFSWNIRGEQRLSRRHLRFASHPLFSLLIEVCLADAAGSIGGEGKGQTIELIRQKWQLQREGTGGEP